MQPTNEISIEKHCTAVEQAYELTNLWKKKINSIKIALWPICINAIFIEFFDTIESLLD